MRYAYGNNSQGSKELFENRRYYDTQIIPIKKEEVDIDMANNTFVDIFVNKPYYGRIDHQSDGVITAFDVKPGPSAPLTVLPFDEKKYLKKFKNRNDIYAMNFVVDAFEDMANYFNRSCQLASNLSKEGIFSVITPEVGWVSARNTYDNYLKSLYDYFIKDYLKNGYEFQIKNFDDFYELFKKFLVNNGDNFSILYSIFCMSRYVSPNISGLVVEIAIDDHSDDFIKTSKYLDNSNYEFFKECAIRYGFYVDRNVPWRLIANLSSSNMVTYMKKYGFEKPEDVFSKQFIKTYKYDLSILRETIAKMYNTLVLNYPTYKKTIINDCIEEAREFNKEIIALDVFYKKYPLEKWLNLYLDLRSLAVREEVDSSKLHHLRKQVKQIFLSSGLEASVTQINNTLNGYGSTLIKKEFFTPKSFDAISDSKQ